MAENKKSFILYCDQISLIEKVSDEMAGQLFKLIFNYVNDKNPVVENNLMLDLLFEPIKLQLKRDLKIWENKIKNRSKAGIASGEARRNKREQNEQVLNVLNKTEQTRTKRTVNVNVNVNDTVINKIGFDVFISLYAKRVDLKKAKLKWDTLDLETQTKIIAIVPEYVKSTPDKQYRKSPLVYLNNESWNDEIIKPINPETIAAPVAAYQFLDAEKEMREKKEQLRLDKERWNKEHGISN